MYFFGGKYCSDQSEQLFVGELQRLDWRLKASWGAISFQEQDTSGVRRRVIDIVACGEVFSWMILSPVREDMRLDEDPYLFAADSNLFFHRANEIKIMPGGREIPAFFGQPNLISFLLRKKFAQSPTPS